jgi:predicted HNH restriction endonuclease
LLFEGSRLPPKAVFGLAASEALGFPVRPENFSAGENTVAFRTLRAHGYLIVPKEAHDVDDALSTLDEERVWAEGNRRLVTHLRRERGAGLASAKRGQFKAQHGKLFCERCGMDPVEAYGWPVGEACIEVHHRDTHLSQMEADHETRLEDLQCLCASCHRVTHRELRHRLEGAIAPPGCETHFKGNVPCYSTR